MNFFKRKKRTWIFYFFYSNHFFYELPIHIPPQKTDFHNAKAMLCLITTAKVALTYMSQVIDPCQRSSTQLLEMILVEVLKESRTLLCSLEHILNLSICQELYCSFSQWLLTYTDFVVWSLQLVYTVVCVSVTFCF